MNRVNIVMTRVLGFAFCLAILVSCSKQDPPKNKAAAGKLSKVTVAQPQMQDVQRIITTVGTLEPEDDVQVTSQVSGIIQEIKFEEGQELKQGDVLAILDPTNFRLNVENSRALLDRAQSDLSLAQANYEREKKLFEKNLVSEQEFQQYAAAQDSSKAAFASAQAGLKIAEKSLADTVIKTPVDKSGNNYTWEIQKKLVSIGQYINANSGAPIAELVNRTTLKLRFTVPEQVAKYLAINKTVKFTVPAVADKDFEAKIIYIGPQAMESTRSVPVKARFDNAEHVLRPGYSANTRFIAESKDKALVIPRRALRFDVDKPYVFAVKDAILSKRQVVLGIEKEDFVEIISGISASDTIVLRSGSFLNDGAKVEIIESDTSPATGKEQSGGNK